VGLEVTDEVLFIQEREDLVLGGELAVRHLFR
jgi:hypothetical protein